MSESTYVDCSATSQDSLLLQVQNNVEALNQIINSLPEIQRCAYSLPIHPLIQQRQILDHPVTMQRQILK